MSILPLPDPAPETEGLYPSTLDAYAGAPGSLIGVSFWPRVAARLIDIGVHYIVAFSSGVLFGLLIAIAARLQHNPRALALLRRHSNGIALFLLSLLGSILLEAVCEGFHGSTLGKLLLGFVVVKEDGSPCRPRAALIRSLAYVIDALFFGLIGYLSMQKTPQQQRHGDEWAHTVVCHRSAISPQNLRGGGTFVAAFTMGTMADAVLIVSALVLKVLS